MMRVDVEEVSRKGYHRLETVNKYDLSKTTEHVVKAPGSVEQVSVAVMLDGDVSSYSLPAIRSAVEAVAGIDLKRGDKVIVEAVPFDKTAAKAEEKELKAAATRETFVSVGKAVGAVAALLVFLFLLKGIVKQIKLVPPVPLNSERLEPIVAGYPAVEPAANLESEPAPAAVETGPKPAPEPVVVGSPEEVAKVVREWISRD